MKAWPRFRVVSAGALAHDRLRSALAVVAIALGVALGFAVQMINGAAVNELSQTVQALAGDADLQVRGPRSGFDEALYPVLARREEIAVASPVVEVDARVIGREESLHVVGLDLFRAAAIQPALLPDVRERTDILDPDTLFPSAPAAAWLGLSSGERVALQAGTAAETLRIGGLLGESISQRVAVMDIAGVQTHFGRAGVLSRIDLRVRPGYEVDAVARTLAPLLPAGVTIARPETGVTAGTSLSRAYRVNLDVLALVALFTGGLLVFSTQALSVVRRRPQLALLRVIGITRGELVRLLVSEGALLGIAGSVVGLGLGYALGTIALRIVGVDLGSGYFRGVAPHASVDPVAALAFLVLGVLTSIVGSAAPALEAARAAPAQALKAGDEQRAFGRLRPVTPGAVLLAVALLMTQAPPVGDLPIFGYLSIALMLIGTLMLLPRVALLAWQMVPTPRGAAPRLALEQLRRAPGQATVSLASIVASIALMVSMGIMVHSFRTSLVGWLEQVLPADVYVRAAPSGDSGYLPASLQSAIAAMPGVRRVDFIREQQLLLDPARPRVVLMARDVDPAEPERLLPLVVSSTPARSGTPPAWINEPAAALYGWRVGDPLDLPLAGKSVRFTVAGVWRDYARGQGAVVIERARYVALTGDSAASNAAIWLADGASAARARDQLAVSIGHAGALEIAMPEDIRRASLRAFDRTFAVTYALELAAVLIGLVGLSSAFGALVLARKREFGTLRHLGMQKRQIAFMLASEGLLVSGVGMAAGVALGWVMSLVLIHVVNRQSFHWGMELSMPWVPLAAVVGAVLALSMLTAVISGRVAMSGEAVRAVREDW